jgi:UPF0755 protein
VINIPEGRRAVEIFALLSKQTKVPVAEFTKVKKNPRALGLPSWAKGNLEGLLFPGQYNLPPKATAVQLLKPMVDRFKEEMTQLELVSKAQRAHLTPLQAITMASLIEAEAGKPVDYRKISRVIYNRIKIGKHLQFDTPILYYLNKRKLDVRNRDIASVQSPYNLYTHPGLGPGPISSPGLEAIKSVFNPEPGTWLYFVATDPTNLKTDFATTEEQRLKLVEKFRAWQKAHPNQ